MVSASKILTVSYGTFSCTLEGFDDSFETMKAIAEYFRDLAADDRYFGAEPPTPDAEMLARIAEREIARRVEAHEEQGKIVLRAGTAEALPRAETEARAPEVREDDEPREAEAAKAPARIAEDVAEYEDEPAAAEEAVAEEEVTEEVAEDTVAPEEAVEEVAEEAAEEEISGVEDETAEPAAAEPVAEDTLGDEVAEDDFEETPEELAAPEVVAGITEDVAEDVAEEAPEEEIAADLEEVAEDEAPAEEVAQELAEEIDADEAMEPAEAAEAEADEAWQDAVEETAAEEEIAEIAEEEVAKAVEDEIAEVAEDEVAEDAEEEIAEVAAEVSEEIEETAEDVALSDDEDEADSVAAKLRRIRSVVAQSQIDYQVTEYSEYSEDEHAQDVLSDASAELDELLATSRQEAGQDALEDTVSEAVAEEHAEDETAEIEAGDFDDMDEDEDDDEDAVAAAVPEISEDTLAQLLADAMPDTDEVEAEDDAPESIFAELDDDLDTDEDDEEPFVLAGGDRLPEAEGEERPLNARVIKMKRAEFEAAIASGEIEADDEDAIARNMFDETGEQGELSPEDEADLQRELAEVEAELDIDSELEDEAESADFDDWDEDELSDDELESDEDEAEVAFGPSDEEIAEAEAEAEAEAQAEEKMPEKPRRGLARLLGGIKRQPEDVERIFEEADSQLDDKEGSMRRNAIQHLRAAVAATRADKKAGVDIDTAADETPYRSDLAQVVRPRRPMTQPIENRSTRPVEARPAPLKLVAEQRIDTPREPVRPRRVSTQELVQAGHPALPADGGFTEFAEEVGATGLYELLEAAAAYMSDIEGRPEFSRPMLMSKLKEVAKDNYSREDGLRSFGQLLRDGKLQKLKGGRFAVTEDTEFRAPKRNAG